MMKTWKIDSETKNGAKCQLIWKFVCIHFEIIQGMAVGMKEEKGRWQGLVGPGPVLCILEEEVSDEDLFISCDQGKRNGDLAK